MRFQKGLPVVAAIAAMTAVPAFGTVTTPGGKETIHKTLRVGAAPIKWSTAPVPDQSSSDIQVRVRGRTLLIQTDSICSGNATWRDLVVRMNACGKGASPIHFAAVRLESSRRLTVRLTIVVTAP